MAKLQTQRHAPRRSRGMSLIEILVGVVIGLLGILVIFQVLAVAENRKRTTVHGSDAQSAGAIALYQLQRDVQLAGYGFGGAHTKQVGCVIQAYDRLRTGAAGYPTDFSFPLYPVQIVQGLGGAPDTIRVLYGSSDEFITSRAWTSSGAQKDMGSSGRGGFEYGDLVVLTGNPDPAVTPGPKTVCALVQVANRPAAPSNLVAHTDVYDPTAPAPYNGTRARFNKDATWPAAVFVPPAGGGFAINLGKEPQRIEWRVTLPAEANPNRLLATEILFGYTVNRTPPIPNRPIGPAPIATEVADGIVNLQAEYGIDRNNNQVIDTNEWTEAAPSDLAPGPSDLTNTCGDNPSFSWRCVRAIRVALLARSAHWDKSACSPNPQWTSGVDAGGNSVAATPKPFVMTNVDGTAGSADCTEDPPSPNNWRRYRYSVYETVIPMRNMIWGTAP